MEPAVLHVWNTGQTESTKYIQSTQVGFPESSPEPPEDWELPHQQAAKILVKPDGIPVAQLYIDGPHLNFAMGWCVDG